MNYVVAFAKISIDKDDGIELQGTYYGGIAENEQEADEIATECVNLSKGGTVLPAIIQMNDPHDLLDTLDLAQTRFEAKINQMREANDILTRTARTSRKSKKSQLKKFLD